MRPKRGVFGWKHWKFLMRLKQKLHLGVGFHKPSAKATKCVVMVYSESSLNHSAAKHKIAVRPKNRRKPAQIVKRQASTASTASQLSLTHSHSVQGSTSTYSILGSELNYSSSNSPTFLPRNNNVTFAGGWETHSLIFPHYFSSSDSSSRTAASSRTNEGHEKFLTSIEHWTLANEGLKRAISNLSFAFHHQDPSPFAHNTQVFSNSLESICSGLMNFESNSPSHLDSLHESPDGLVLFSPVQPDEGDDQRDCQLKDDQSILVRSSAMRNVDLECDELEHVNVKEMRKIFLITTTPSLRRPDTIKARTNGGQSQEDDRDDDAPSPGDFSGLEIVPRSFVRSIVMKFDGLAGPNM